MSEEPATRHFTPAELASFLDELEQAHPSSQADSGLQRLPRALSKPSPRGVPRERTGLHLPLTDSEERPLRNGRLDGRRLRALGLALGAGAGLLGALWVVSTLRSPVAAALGSLTASRAATVSAARRSLPPPLPIARASTAGRNPSCDVAPTPVSPAPVSPARLAPAPIAPARVVAPPESSAPVSSAPVFPASRAPARVVAAPLASAPVDLVLPSHPPGGAMGPDSPSTQMTEEGRALELRAAAAASAARSPARARARAEPTVDEPLRREAVELLVAGRTREALDAYRALPVAVRTPAVVAIVRYLERELETCSERAGTSCGSR